MKDKYGISNWELLKASFSREWLLMKRETSVYIFKITQITIMSISTFTVLTLRTTMPAGNLGDGRKFFGALFFCLVNMMFNGTTERELVVSKLPVLFKQRDFMFHPAWVFGLPIWILRIPLSLLESGIWIILSYYTVGFAPSADRYYEFAFFKESSICI